MFEESIDLIGIPKNTIILRPQWQYAETHSEVKDNEYNVMDQRK